MTDWLIELRQKIVDLALPLAVLLATFMMFTGALALAWVWLKFLWEWAT